MVSIQILPSGLFFYSEDRLTCHFQAPLCHSLYLTSHGHIITAPRPSLPDQHTQGLSGKYSNQTEASVLQQGALVACCTPVTVTMQGSINTADCHIGCVGVSQQTFSLVKPGLTNNINTGCIPLYCASTRHCYCTCWLGVTYYWHAWNGAETSLMVQVIRVFLQNYLYMEADYIGLRNV